MIQHERVKPLNPHAVSRGDYVLYWMQASQRAECNHALEFAIQKANEMAKPLVVYFGLTDGYPEANDRHYRFMLEGLREVGEALRRRGIKFVIRHEPPEQGVVDLGSDACLVVADRGYLKVQRAWRRLAAERLRCAFIQVETDAVVPVEAASPKEEFTAATFRPKIRRKLPLFLVPLEEDMTPNRLHTSRLRFAGLERRRGGDGTVWPSRGASGRAGDFHGGTSEARKRLDVFLSQKLDRYPEERNDPTADGLSNLSPYLHFGQISPLFIALRVLQTRSPGADAYLEELIVRRELSLNYVFYNPSYDSFEGLPAWTQKTLVAHERDRKKVRVHAGRAGGSKNARPLLERGPERDAAHGQDARIHADVLGKEDHRVDRVPAEAFRIALYLNNKYELDGRDPNGFTGVAWCFGKHDRPWRERAILGKVRYMNDRGLLRKFDADKYAGQWAPDGAGDVSGQGAAARGARRKEDCVSKQIEGRDLRQLLRQLFAAQRLCVLATQGRGQPYGSLVAFAETEGIDSLLFATSRASRKYSNLSTDPRVALIIDSRSNADADFSQALAVTATGSAHEASGEARERLAKVYLAKHPHLAEFVRSPQTALCRVEVDEYVIAGFTKVVKLRPRG